MTRDSERPSGAKPAQTPLGDGDSVGSDPTTETYLVQHDWASHSSLSITVVEAVASVIGEESTDMKPLHSVLDPDALDTLLSGTDAGVQVEFEYEERSVTVTQSGEVVVR